MDYDFAHEARSKRRRKELTLTSQVMQAQHYGAPSTQRKAATFDARPIDEVRDHVTASTVHKSSTWPAISKAAGAVEAHVEPIHHLQGLPARMHVQHVSISSEQERKRLQNEMQRLTTDKTVLYHPLHDGETFRIFKLYPGKGDQPLRGDLRYTHLRNIHENYEALSYVWGRPNLESNQSTRNITTIQCNGTEIQITPNLLEALHYLRHEREACYYFVDAICINQEDKTERGHQVSLMGSVYSNASRVVIWLGQSAHVSTHSGPNNITSAISMDIRAQRSFGAICHVVNRWLEDTKQNRRANYSHRSSAPSNRWLHHDDFNEFPVQKSQCEDEAVMCERVNEFYTKSVTGGKNLASIPKAMTQMWLSIADLFEAPWFWRVWVVQEVTLAKDAVVRWGDAQIDWRWVGTAAAVLRTNYRDICETLNIGGVYNAYLSYRMSPKLTDLASPRLSFLDLMRLTRQLNCTDERDRAYGLLSIRTHDNIPRSDNLFVKPDYTVSPYELWRRIAWKSITATRNLSILSSVQYTAASTHRYESEDQVTDTTDIENSSLRPTETLPSWVPNWGKLHRATIAPWDQDDSFEAAKDFPLELSGCSTVCPDVLTANGILIGRIGYRGEFMEFGHRIDFIDTKLLLSEQLGPFFASTGGLRLMSRTFTAGRDAYGSLTEHTEPALSDFAAYILHLHENFTAIPGPEDLSSPETLGFRNKIFEKYPGLKSELQAWARRGDADRFVETTVSMCERRRLFLTPNGFLGLGPDTIQKGDFLVVLSGSDVPLVLRPVSYVDPSRRRGVLAPDAHPTSPERYLLVGECYVEGLMKGEAVPKADKQEQLLGPVRTDLVLRELITGSPSGLTALELQPLRNFARIWATKQRFDII